MLQWVNHSTQVEMVICMAKRRKYVMYHISVRYFQTSQLIYRLFRMGFHDHRGVTEGATVYGF